jgi:hypothetical protein
LYRCGNGVCKGEGKPVVPRRAFSQCPYSAMRPVGVESAFMPTELVAGTAIRIRINNRSLSTKRIGYPFCEWNTVRSIDRDLKIKKRKYEFGEGYNIAT